MPKNRNSLKNPRTHAFKNQQGLCYYCRYPMWNDNPEEFIKKTGISKRQLRFSRCTGEHLLAHSEGGPSNLGNIVAACAYCNMSRHSRKKPLDHEQYGALVAARVQKGRWGTCQFFKVRDFSRNFQLDKSTNNARMPLS